MRTFSGLKVIAEGVGVHERAAALPILGRGLGVDNERVGARTFRDRITDAGQRIVGYGIGERKGIGLVAVVLVLLAACDGKVRERLMFIRPAPATCEKTPSKTRSPR